MINIDKNNVMLTGEMEGSFYPSCQSEMQRNVMLKGPFYLKGGIFSQYLKNNGGGTVTGPVLASAEVTLSQPVGNPEPLRFLSGISATISIAMEEKAGGLEETVISNMKNAGLIIRGDVVSDMIKLENALIFGNLRGRQISVVNSIIIGSILAEEELIIENSKFVSFSGGHVVLKGDNGCWLPYGTSLTPIEFTQLRYMAVNSTKDGDGKKTWLNSFQTDVHDEQKTVEPVLMLGPGDVTKHKTKDGLDIYALNIARRALNLVPLEEEIKTIEEFLKGILMYEHLDKSSQEREKKEWEKKFRPEELELLIFTMSLI
jgi:hypothetical protein